MVARNINTVPLIAINRIVDYVVRAAIGVDKADSVSTVGIDQVVDDEGSRIVTGDLDATVATTVAVAKDPIKLDMDTAVAVIAAHHSDRLCTRTGNRQTAYGNEVGSSDPDGELVGALWAR